MSRLLPGKHFSFELARKLPSRLMSVTTLPAEGKLKPTGLLPSFANSADMPGQPR
jgi:hypothetical protein